MINESIIYNPQTPIKIAAILKSKVQQEIQNSQLLEIISQSSVEFPELTYTDKKALEQQIYQLYQSANTSAYELLRSKQDQLNQTCQEKVYS